MKITRKLIVERERRLTIKFGGATAEKFCAACNQSAQFVTTDEAAAIMRTTARAVFRLAEANQVHFDESDNGSLMICRASLSKITDDDFGLPERGSNDY